MTAVKESTNGLHAVPPPPPTGLALLREPFPAHQISKLPKQQKKDDQDRGKCERGSRYSADGFFCGGWHARSLHLDYVGHAALTDRLLDCDPEWDWDWEQRAVDPALLAKAIESGNADIVRMVIRNSPPLLDRDGGAWILLTVCGVTRRGYADAGGKSGANAMKERIGDGLRNAAMRFGAALDLWHKGDLHADLNPEPDAPAQRSQPAAPPEQPREPREPSGRDWTADVKTLGTFDADTATEDLSTKAQALRDLRKECKDGFGEMTAQLDSAITKAGKALVAEIEKRATTPPAAQ